MFFHKMSPPQAQDSRPIGAEAASERPQIPSFEEDIFVNAVEKLKNDIQSVSVEQNVNDLL